MVYRSKADMHFQLKISIMIGFEAFVSQSQKAQHDCSLSLSPFRILTEHKIARYYLQGGI